MQAWVGRPWRLRFRLLPDPGHNATGHLDGPGDCRPADGKTPCDLGNAQLFINQPEQFIEHTQGKPRDTQKWVRQHGKRPPALIVFAKIALDVDELIAGKAVALVFAILDDVDSVIAPATNHRSGLIFLGSVDQIPYNAQQGWGHGFSPFFPFMVKG
jgi:hypothetical protein